MTATRLYHPAEAEALACFELKLHTVMEGYFRALRERVVSLAERDGTLPVTFWMCERDMLVELLSPIYEAGVRLGIELECPPRAALNAFVNLNTAVQTTIQQLVSDLAQEITVMASRRVSELLNMGLNPQGLPDRLRQELHNGVLSDSYAGQLACQGAGRALAAGRLFARPSRQFERVERLDYMVNRLCI